MKTIYKAVVGKETNESEKELFFDPIPAFITTAKQMLQKFSNKATIRTNSLDRLQFMDAKLTIPEVILGLKDLGIYYLEVRESRKLKFWINLSEVNVISLETEEEEEETKASE